MLRSTLQITNSSILKQGRFHFATSQKSSTPSVRNLHTITRTLATNNLQQRRTKKDEISLVTKFPQSSLHALSTPSKSLSLQVRTFASLSGGADSSFRLLKRSAVLVGTGMVIWYWGWPIFKFVAFAGGVFFALNWAKNAWVRRRAQNFYDNVINDLQKYRPAIERELGMPNSYEFPPLGAGRYYVEIQQAQIGEAPFIHLEFPASGSNGQGKVIVVGQVMDFRFVKNPTPTNRFLLRKVSLSYLTQLGNGSIGVKQVDLDSFPEEITIVDAEQSDRKP